MTGPPTDEQRVKARRRAKARRDCLMEQLVEAERRGHSARVNVLRDAVSKKDREARGAA